MCLWFFWMKEISGAILKKKATVAINATVSLLGNPGARVTNDRMKTMVHHGYTASTISSPGVYVTTFTHDPKTLAVQLRTSSYWELTMVSSWKPTTCIWRGRSDIEKEAIVAINATVSLLGNLGTRVTNNRMKTMVQHGYTASTISLPGVYVTTFVHDPRQPGGAVKKTKPLRINHIIFLENQKLALENIKATSLWMLGTKMKSQLEEALHPVVVNGWNKKLVHVWDVDASVAKVAGAEISVRSCINELHCTVFAPKDVCSDFHIDDNNNS